MTKNERVFQALMSGRSFNRFEAAQLLHDHCLHSTVATLERKYHVTISRKYEAVRGYMGVSTQCCRYWIEEEERQRFISKQQERKSENPTDQGKESGSNYSELNPADEQCDSQIASELDQ